MFFFSSIFIYFERKREKVGKSRERERERERQNLKQTLHCQNSFSAEPAVGLKLTNREIMT